MKVHWYKEKQKKFEEYEAYVSSLEQRYNEALDELKNVAVGFVLSEDNNTNWSTSTKLQNRAATFLRRLATKTKISKPMMYL